MLPSCMVDATYPRPLFSFLKLAAARPPVPQHFPLSVFGFASAPKLFRPPHLRAPFARRMRSSADLSLSFPLTPLLSTATSDKPRPKSFRMRSSMISAPNFFRMRSSEKRCGVGALPMFQRQSLSPILTSLPPYLLTSLLPYFLSSPVRPIAANRPWCHNWQRRENSSPSGETTPLPPVSKNRERTSGTVRRRSRSHPDSVGVASRAWVQRSNAGFRVCTCKPRAKLDRSRVARATFPCRTESALASVKDAGKCRVGKAGSVRLGQCPFLGPR